MELPEGWVQINLEEIVEILDNKRIPLNSDERAKRKGIYPYYGANGQVDTIDDYLFNGNHVLIAEDGGYFDNPTRDVAYRVTGRFWVNNHAHIVRGLGGITSRFLLYALNKVDWMQYVSGTTRLKLTQASLKKVSLLLPPLNEQKRIVAAIEALRERSQKARSALSAIPELCDKFRQSVLAAAFRGDLTADWREQNPDVEPASVLLERIHAAKQSRLKTKYKEPEPLNISDLPEIPNKWIWATTSELADVSLGKMLDKGREQKGKPFPYLRNLNIRWGYIDTTDLLEMYFEEHELDRYNVFPGDILICEGGEPGRAAVWEGDAETFKYQKAIHRARPYVGMEPLWFVYHLMLEAGNGVLEQYFTGTTIKHLTGVALSRYPIRLASLEEQKEIVSRIRKLFEIANFIEQEYQDTRQYLNQLDRSILAKAFRGELVEQDPKDEPASVLLDRIRVDREQQMQGKIKKPGKKKRTGD